MRPLSQVANVGYFFICVIITNAGSASLHELRQTELAKPEIDPTLICSLCFAESYCVCVCVEYQELVLH